MLLLPWHTTVWVSLPLSWFLLCFVFLSFSHKFLKSAYRSFRIFNKLNVTMPAAWFYYSQRWFSVDRFARISILLAIAHNGELFKQSSISTHALTNFTIFSSLEIIFKKNLSFISFCCRYCCAHSIHGIVMRLSISQLPWNVEKQVDTNNCNDKPWGYKHSHTTLVLHWTANTKSFFKRHGHKVFDMPIERTHALILFLFHRIFILVTKILM